MLLGIDTSTVRLSLALGDGEKTFAVRAHTAQRRHNETLLPMLAAALEEIHQTPADIQGIAVGLGPGSFTGVRVGLAAVLGMAQALNLPVVGVPSYLIIAALSGEERVAVVGDARRNMFYAACYERRSSGWTAVMAETLVSPPDLLQRLPAGRMALSGPDAGGLYHAWKLERADLVLVPEARRWPEAETLIRLATGTIPNPFGSSLQKGGIRLQDLIPIYLRRPQAEEMRLDREMPAGGIL
ncbi:tRNA (adenosine(37)-N6)-threonylcarbamoyltransferase complex dimerization subunit type 1 TsaB [candidate division FCPU426 bacterium]|nr:tRNA (adenosine(37)-N6)-threonylcarbamoyltransferase complex dimerization subunit type 1 TsaB [candidate division FCPU426 bacterium]